MQRKSGFPVANCSIKMPDSASMASLDPVPCEEDTEQRRQQLINFGHSQWGFNNWSWTVTKQEMDFVDPTANGKFCAGVVAFVSITVKSFDIQRENIGYATSIANNKGLAIFKSRKCAVTNALRETLLSFGGSVATELMELLDAHKNEAPSVPNPIPNPPEQDNNQNLPNKPVEPKNSPVNKIRKEENSTPANCVRPHPPPAIKNAPVANPPPPPPVAKAHPMPVSLPAAANRPPPRAPAPAPPHRPNSNVSFVLQPVMGGLPPPLYAPPPRLAPPHVGPPHMFPNYYEYAGPWHFTYESYDRHHGNVNLNFNIPPKNLVVNSRSGSVECKNACGVRPGPEGEPIQYAPPPQNQGCWIKPTIFYDGFWTEQKVKKWVAEQVEKQFPEDTSNKSSSPSSGQPEPANSKSHRDRGCSNKLKKRLRSYQDIKKITEKREEASPLKEAEMSEEEARAERKRRQQLAKEEFLLKQLSKKAGNDDKELSKASSSIDKLLLGIPTQDIVIEESGAETRDDVKRKSSADGGAPKRRNSMLNRLDIVAD